MSSARLLCDVARVGDSSAIQILIDQGADPDGDLARRDVPLLVASERGHLSVVRQLIDARANLNFVNSDGKSALSSAISYHHEDVAQLLVSAGADTETQRMDLLCAAARHGFTAIVDVLIERTAGPVPDYGYALQKALANGHRAVASRLISAGADINSSCPSSGKPLAIAADWNLVDIVELLLQAGADANAPCKRHGSALICASRHGNIKLVERLLAAGAEVDFVTTELHIYFRCALHSALGHGHEDLARVLIRAGADIAYSCRNQGTALQIAAGYGFTALVDELLCNGAVIDAAGGRRGPPLVRASGAGHLDVVTTLLAAGADVDTRNTRYGTALIAASARGQLEVVGKLLSAGASLFYSGLGYGSALSVAILRNHSEVAETLREAEKGPNARVFRFLDLPPEVRTMVYFFATRESSQAGARMTITPPQRLVHSSVEAIVERVPSGLRALLQTSQHMRKECLPFFWRRAVFQLSSNFFGPKILRLGSIACHNIRILSITETITGKRSLDDVYASLCTLKGLPLLASVDISVGYRDGIEQVLSPGCASQEVETDIFAPETEREELCIMLMNQLEAPENKCRTFKFRFRLRSSRTPGLSSCKPMSNASPLSCQLSCCMRDLMMLYFAPDGVILDSTICHVRPTRRLEAAVIGEIDMTRVAATSSLDDAGYLERSMFAVLLARHDDEDEDED